MEMVQIITTLPGCPAPTLGIAAEHYEVVRAWIDFLYGKVGFDEAHTAVLQWAQKYSPAAPLDAISDTIRSCANALLRARGT